LEQQHHLERAGRDRWDSCRREATEVAGAPARDVDCVGAVVDPEVVAAQLPGDEASRAADAATQVQHRDAGADARLPRQLPDLARPHEALLFDELAGRVRRDPGPLEGAHEGSPLILLHGGDASPPIAPGESVPGRSGAGYGG